MPGTKPTEEAVVSVRRLPVQTTRPSEAPRWEVSHGNQATGWRVIGWIEARRPREGQKVFYLATGIHPRTGEHHELEGGTDFDDRVNTIGDFHRDPMTSRQYLYQH